MEEYYTVKEFAEKHRVSKQAVYLWIQQGILEAVEEQAGPIKVFLIPKKMAKRFKRPPMGRPRKKS